MGISKERAEAVLLEEVALSSSGQGISSEWVERVERLSAACDGAAKTHIAFLGTAMLAKAIDLDVDVLAVKAKSPIAGQKPPPGAYSARSLGHGVLVPLATEVGINLGVSGREPLNNQPYFRMIRIDDGTPIHGNSRAAFLVLKEILNDLGKISTEVEARAALRAFIHVRRKVRTEYSSIVDAQVVPASALISLISHFVSANAEGGKRAQAVVAGLLDVFAGERRVDAGRINDPSRHYPGDVVIRDICDPDTIEKAFEVRDKAVSVSDILIFGQKALEMGVREAAVVAVSPSQPPVDLLRVSKWAMERNMGLTVFFGWEPFVRQVLFWAALPERCAGGASVGRIHARLVEVEVSEEGANKWAAEAAALVSGAS